MLLPCLRPGSLLLIVAIMAIMALTSCRSEPTQSPPASVALEPDEPTPAPDPAQPPPFAWQRQFELASDTRTYAVISSGVGLWISPDASEPAATFTSYQFERHGAVLVLGRVGEFVEVQLDWEIDARLAHCQQPAFGLGLRVFVREAELADVIVEPQVIDSGDGTGFNVAPGVLVRADANGITLEARGFGSDNYGIYAHLPADTALRIGKIYRPARVLAGVRESWREQPGTIRAGNEEHRVPATLSVFARAEHDPNYVLVGGECLQIAGHYTADEPIELPPPGRGGGGTAEGTIALPLGSIIGKGGPERDFPNLWEIPAGSELSWPDGSPAGIAVDQFIIQQKPTRRGSRRCFVPHFDSDWAPSLSFCVPAKVARFIG